MGKQILNPPNGPSQIGKTNHLKRAFAFGQTLHPPEALA